MFDLVINFLIKITETIGYPGVFFLMILESTALPVPSETVMPFAGFLWSLGKMSFGLIILASTLGSIVGSIFSYYIGLYGGKPLLKRYGKYLLLNEKHLLTTEKFFNQHGSKTIFISRFIPIIRHLISLPAGFSRMALSKFIVYTILGAGLWNSILTFLGYYLGSQWTIIRKYSEIIDIILIILIAGFIVFFFYKKLNKSKC